MDNEFDLISEAYQQVNEGVWDRTKGHVAGAVQNVKNAGSKVANTAVAAQAAWKGNSNVAQHRADKNSNLKTGESAKIDSLKKSHGDKINKAIITFEQELTKLQNDYFADAKKFNISEEDLVQSQVKIKQFIASTLGITTKDVAGSNETPPPLPKEEPPVPKEEAPPPPPVAKDNSPAPKPANNKIKFEF